MPYVATGGGRLCALIRIPLFCCAFIRVNVLRRRAGQLLVVAGVGVFVVGFLVVACKFAGIALLGMNVLVHTTVIRKRDGWLCEGKDGECGNHHRD